VIGLDFNSLTNSSGDVAPLARKLVNRSAIEKRY
jgi:hypothetical protein